MTYFEARRAEMDFRRYRQLALDYWAAVRPLPATDDAELAGRFAPFEKPISYVDQARATGPGAPTHLETEASSTLRTQIKMFEEVVVMWTRRLGLDVSGACAPPAFLRGQPAVPFSYLSLVVNQWVGYRSVERREVIDAIDKCIGAADFTKRRILARALKPWNWLVDIPALIVGWPFYVMRKAGVPDKIVESTGSQAIKAVLVGLLWLVGFAYTVYRTGLAKAVHDVLAK